MPYDKMSSQSSICRLPTDRRGYINELTSRTASIMSLASNSSFNDNEWQESDELELTKFLEEEDKELAKLLSDCDEMKKNRLKNEESK